MKIFRGPNFLMEDSSTFFYISLIMLVGLVIRGEFIMAAIAAVLILLALRLSTTRYEDKKKELNQYLIEFTNTIDGMSRQALLNVPIPLVIISDTGVVYWYNSKFKEIMRSKKGHKENIKEYFPSFPLAELLENGDSSSFDLQSDNRNYNVMYNKVEGSGEESTVYLLYLLDNTRFQSLKEVYMAEKSIVALVEIDNFDEMYKTMDMVSRASLMAGIEKQLDVFAQRMNGYTIKYLDDRFIIMFESRFLENLETKKFDILEEIKEIRTEKDEFFTLSFGVGTGGKTLNQQFDYAKGALSIALGRGGDQAVIKSSGKVKYYGGRSKAVEKRTKVKARMISNAIRQIFSQSSNVIITGHKTGDMDSLGAALGIYAIAKGMGKKAYIVLNELNAALTNIHEKMTLEGGEYTSIIINNEEALKLIDEDTVAVVVDTHKPSYCEAGEILESFEKIMVIDHHRRGEEYIEDPILDYVEPYASSTCELIAELFQYMDDKIHLTKLEANAMLSGIIMDTNAFTFKTGVRTFEAASYLRRAGADTIESKRLLSDDIDTWKKKSEVIERAEIIDEIIAISMIDEIFPTGLIIASQSAADLLSVKGVIVSFVLVRRENHIHVSARSVGDVNVQIIMEQLGGGGHLEIAGAQIETQDMNYAKELLLKEIEKYRKDNKKI
jgi:c-di-AMP phosphodiesterase-like protein